MNANFFTVLFILCTFASQAKIDLIFSKSRGYYSNSLTLVLEASDANATIKYTTNGRTPNPNIGSTYNSPLNISSTTVIKAIAFTATDTSKIIGHSYIFVQDVLNQPDSTSGFPYATGFSSSITNDGQYGAMLDEAILAIPTMSLSLKLSDYDYIYNNKGISKQAYIEYIDPNNTESYGRLTGVSTYGNTSFSAANANKKNYRLRFKDEFGADKYKHKIFGDEAASDFDVIDLRCGSQESFDRGGVQNIHEQVLKDMQIQMSTYGVHGKFAHLYINGIYWGVYTAGERPTKSFGESYFGGSKDDYNTAKATCCDSEALAIDGTIASYDYMRTNTSNYPAIEQYLDVDHFIDYVILCNYGPHGDWRTWNTYAIDNPTANVPYRFFMWDPEPSLLNDWYYTDQIVDTRDHEDIWQPLKSNADFRMRFADHVECNCIQDDGPLNPANIESHYDATFQANKLAYLAEAARWGNKTLYNEFLNYRNTIINSNWFSKRMDTLTTAYKNNNLYPSLNSVSQNQYGGIVSQNFQINLSNTNNSGTLYYTLDRTDPRAAGGSVSNTAQNYSGSFTLPNGVYELKARVKSNSMWSAMCPRKFYVGQNYNDVVINEIHYNPSDSIYYNNAINAMDTVSGRNFEFIELKNKGAQPVYLEDVSFNKGVTASFDENAIIPAGGFFIVAEDAFWFEEKYGFPPNATYIGKLENSGENLSLLNPMKSIIDTLKYDDALPWDTIPDNGIYSLALIDALADNSTSNNWAAQTVKVTPGAENIFCDGSLTYTEMLANISCPGFSDGFITGNASGGTSPYTYLWSNGTSNNTISNLNAGSYALNVIDVNGCTFTQSYTLSEPSPITVSSTTVNQSYYQVNDGSASVTTSGGTSPYTYSWSNGANTNSINNLAPGNYTVNVTDAYGCIFTETVTINTVDCSTLSASIMATNQSYFQIDDGVASVTVSGGTSPYDYSWSNGQSTSSINNLSPGTYTVDVIDNAGCELSELVVIDAIDCNSISASITATNQSYYQTNDGTASVTVSGGASPYNYDWSNGLNTNSITNLAPGTYTVNIIDNAGCAFSETVTIEAVDCSSISSSITSTNQSYYQTDDGTATVAVSGGSSPYNYTWSNGASAVSVGNLAPGAYSVDIIDNAGCALSETVTIDAVDCSTLTVTATSTNQSYNQINDGSASVTVSGGTTPYIYNWSNGANTNSIANLASGTYSVDVTDKLGCTRSETVIINAIDCSAFSASSTSTDQSYFQTNDGTASVTASGGVSPYSYDWSNGLSTATVSNLAPGNYTVNITDDLGCVLVETIVIDPVNCSALSASISSTDQSYYQTDNGTASVTVSGGTLPYSYSWSNGLSSSSVSNLAPGPYTVDITDGIGCAITKTVVINTLDCSTLIATITSTNQSYLQTDDGTASATVSGGAVPYNYSWSNGASTNTVADLAPGSYSVDITDNQGCALTKTIIIDAVDCSALSASITSTNQSYYQTDDGTASITVSNGVAPLSYLWSNGETVMSISNLTPATYSVDVTDAIGCSVSESVVVNPLSCDALNVSVSVQDETCAGDNDGSLNITDIQNGIAPYSIQWSDGQTSLLRNNLPGNNYQLSITDAEGCPFNNTYTVNTISNLTINPTVTNASTDNAFDGSIDLVLNGGSLPYQFYWSNAANTQNISGIQSGFYWVSITDSNNCQTIATSILVESDCPTSLIQQNQPALNTQVYQAADFIESNGMVNMKKQVSFKAGDFIEMTNDFEVILGAEFEADIEGCQ